MSKSFFACHAENVPISNEFKISLNYIFKMVAILESKHKSDCHAVKFSAFTSYAFYTAMTKSIEATSKTFFSHAVLFLDTG